MSSHSLWCVSAAGYLEVRAEMGGIGQGAAESLERAVVCDCLTDDHAGALHSPRKYGTEITVHLD